MSEFLLRCERAVQNMDLNDGIKNDELSRLAGYKACVHSADVELTTIRMSVLQEYSSHENVSGFRSRNNDARKEFGRRMFVGSVRDDNNIDTRDVSTLEEAQYIKDVTEKLTPDVLWAANNKRDIIHNALKRFFMNGHVSTATNSPWVPLLKPGSKLHAVLYEHVEEYITTTPATIHYVSDFSKLLVLLDLARIGFSGSTTTENSMIKNLRRDERISGLRLPISRQDMLIVNEESDRAKVAQALDNLDAWRRQGGYQEGFEFKVQPALADMYSYSSSEEETDAQTMFEQVVMLSICHNVVSAIEQRSNVTDTQSAHGQNVTMFAIEVCLNTLSIPMRIHAHLKTDDFLEEAKLLDLLLFTFLTSVASSAHTAVTRLCSAPKELVGYGSQSLVIKSNDQVCKHLTEEYFGEFSDELLLHGSYEFLYYDTFNRYDNREEYLKSMQRHAKIATNATSSFVMSSLVETMGFDIDKHPPKLIVYWKYPNTTSRIIVTISIKFNVAGQHGDKIDLMQKAKTFINKLYPEHVDYFTLFQKGSNQSSFAPAPHNGSTDTSALSHNTIPENMKALRIKWWAGDNTLATQTCIPSRLSSAQINAHDNNIISMLQAPETAYVSMADGEMTRTFDMLYDQSIPLIQHLNETASRLKNHSQNEASQSTDFEKVYFGKGSAISSHALVVFSSMLFPEFHQNAFVIEAMHRDGSNLFVKTSLPMIRNAIQTHLAVQVYNDVARSLVNARNLSLSRQAAQATIDSSEEALNELYRLGVIYCSVDSDNPVNVAQHDMFPNIKTITTNEFVKRRSQTYMASVVDCVRTLGKHDVGGVKIDALNYMSQTDATNETETSVLPEYIYDIFDALETSAELIQKSLVFLNTLDVANNRAKRYGKHANRRDVPSQVIIDLQLHMQKLNTYFEQKLSRLVTASRTRVDWVDAGFYSRDHFLSTCNDALEFVDDLKHRWDTGKIGVFIAIVGRFSQHLQGKARQNTTDAIMWLRRLIMRLHAVDVKKIQEQLNESNDLREWLDETENGYFRVATALHTGAMMALTTFFARKPDQTLQEGIGAFDTIGSYSNKEGYKLNRLVDKKKRKTQVVTNNDDDDIPFVKSGEIVIIDDGEIFYKPGEVDEVDDKDDDEDDDLDGFLDDDDDDDDSI